MERVVVNRSFTLYKTFYADGVATDPTGTPTVTITRLSTGATVTTGAVTDEAGVGTWSVTVAATANTLLDTLAVTWTATVNATPQQYVDTVEVAGGTIFTIADARAYSGLGATNNDGSYKISTAAIVAARTEVERALEHELDFAMVPRYSRATLDGNGQKIVALKPHPRVIRTATVAGTALVPSDLAMTPTGLLYNPTGWTSGCQNVVIGYEHGRDYPPARAKDVALALVRRAVAGSPADDRATSVSTDQETTTFYVPGGSEPFDIPAANRFVAANTLRTGVA